MTPIGMWFIHLRQVHPSIGLPSQIGCLSFHTNFQVKTKSQIYPYSSGHNTQNKFYIYNISLRTTKNSKDCKLISVGQSTRHMLMRVLVGYL